jgi:hypothetical protein
MVFTAPHRTKLLSWMAGTIAWPSPSSTNTCAVSRSSRGGSGVVGMVGCPFASRGSDQGPTRSSEWRTGKLAQSRATVEDIYAGTLTMLG